MSRLNKILQTFKFWSKILEVPFQNIEFLKYALESYFSLMDIVGGTKLFWTIIINMILHSKKYFCQQILYKYI